MRQTEMNDKINSFLASHNYDVRETGDARWIDQKCTFDVINIISDCIIEYIDYDHSKEFTVSDIWHSNYARENVITIFSKPDPELKAGNEYDKYFGQPIKLLSYSKLLCTRKVGNRYFYKVADYELLKYISTRPMNTLYFLMEYIKKVLVDSNIWEYFSDFFQLQTKESYFTVKDTFANFTMQFTPINQKVECGRIFTKIINPLAFGDNKCGSERGHISKYPIKLEELQYNRQNWRDILSKKDKSIPRTEHENISELKGLAYVKYSIDKAKRDVRNFNRNFRKQLSEVRQEHMLDPANHIHHIFPQSDFPEISAYVENLIALTPSQHLNYAHPNNNTNRIDVDYQYICILSKTCTIFENVNDDSEEEVYDFDRFKYVLNTGLDTFEFNSIAYLDFPNLLNEIDCYYIDRLTDNYSNVKDTVINLTSMFHNMNYGTNRPIMLNVAEERTNY